MKHKYYENVQLTSSVGSIANHHFTLNGMFDPNITGIGHQPYYFDQMTVVYNHYTVVGTKVTIQILSNTNSGSISGQFVLWQNDDTVVTPTSFFGLVEQSKGVLKTISHLSARPQFASLKWSAKKTFGGTVTSNPSLQGTASANPAEQSFAALSYQSQDAASTSSIRCGVTIEYIAVWSELKDVPTS